MLYDPSHFDRSHSGISTRWDVLTHGLGCVFMPLDFFRPKWRPKRKKRLQRSHPTLNGIGLGITFTGI